MIANATRTKFTRAEAGLKSETFIRPKTSQENSLYSAFLPAALALAHLARAAAAIRALAAGLIRRLGCDTGLGAGPRTFAHLAF